MNLDEYALQLSDNVLDDHFDAEAYLVKFVAEQKLSQKQDLVPNSNIDECIQYLMDSFIEYMNNRTLDNYKHLLNILRQILSELYHTTNDTDQQIAFAEFIEKCSKIK